MKTVNRKIEELKPSEYNPRKISEKQLNDLKKSMRKLDILEPAVVNMHQERQNIIISGHQRIRAAQELGIKEYPCVEVNFDLDKEKEANIRMNKSGGDWDFELLEENFELEDLVYAGFDSKELDFGSDDKPKEKRQKELTMKCPECGHEWTK